MKNNSMSNCFTLYILLVSIISTSSSQIGISDLRINNFDSFKWLDGIVYYDIDYSSYNDEDVALIRSAMEEFHLKTCIRWVERNLEDDFVEIENEPGCSAEHGRQGGPQVLYLQSPDCMTKGVILHEMMHTLGFIHEISRPDRDDYVNVIWDNIIPGMEGNFIMISPTKRIGMEFDYDYMSVMHYPAWSFAADRSKPTIRPKENVPLRDLGWGQSNGSFTETDLKKIRHFYNCKE